ncbi:MAG: hypothetical protein ABH885_06485 [Candidatus Omnitrophota bacterium]
MNIRKTILLSLLFSTAFCALDRMPLADSFKLELIFRYITIPVWQWALVFIYALVFGLSGSADWKRVLVKGAVIGIIFTLYLPMLDTQKAIWQGVVFSGLYVWIINAFILAYGVLVCVFGIYCAVRIFGRDAKKTDYMMMPVSMLALYGVGYYFSAYHVLEAVSMVSGAVILWIIINMPVRRRVFNTRFIALCVFVFALAVRILFLANLLNIEGNNYPFASDDGDTYETYAVRALADPSIFIKESPHYFMVFYSAFITGVYKIFGHGFFTVGAAQSVIGAFSCVLIFLLAYGVTGSRVVGILSSAGIAVNSALIQLTVTLSTEALYIPLIILFVYMLFLYGKRQAKGQCLVFLMAAGVSLGLSALIRELAVYLSVFAAAWIIFYGADYGSLRIVRRIRDAALFFVLMMLVILPVTLANYRNTGKFYLIYNTANRSSWVTASSWGEDLVPSNKRLIDLGLTDPISDPSGSMKAFLESPGEVTAAFAEIIPKRMRNIFLWPNFGYFDPVYLVNNAKYANRYASYLEFYVILLMAAGLFIFLFSKIKASYKALILLVVVFYALMHGVIFLSQSPRYKAPMDPFIAIVTAYGLWVMLRHVLMSFGREKAS